MRYGDLVRDDKNRQSTLVLAGGMFELGFFTPSHSTDGRQYVGIWYHKLSPRTVVWVANRKRLVVNSRSRGIVFGITEDGNLKVFDSTSGTGEPYWSSELENCSSSSNRTMMLLDSGNLVLTELGTTTLWESFGALTNTFLPEMKMDENLMLTSWRDKNDPRPGVFSSDYKMPNVIVNFLSNFTEDRNINNIAGINRILSNFTEGPKCINIAGINSSELQPRSNFSYTRLVILSTGKIRYENWDKVWNLIWSEPRDMCSKFNVCGEFGSCNNGNKTVAWKCLPRFKPSFENKGNSEDFSDGCTRGLKLCDGKKLHILELENGENGCGARS
ncbi:S-locus glycoprotein [Parasponia andersonii]|uniref:S-locus glycoprotein n=1 Tax=Parasponia andersonii TaxID=3476 RepID=A0A2P5E4P0_PARAD|nr:S-locus glycoprotein [Parasponia andersonii]